MSACAKPDLGIPRTALVVGANGFLGGHVAAALRQRGWRVLGGVRPTDCLRSDERAVDLAQMTTPETWRETLVGIDVVINASGILRENGAQSFETIHVRAPKALATACLAAGVQSFVQISSLGMAADGEFIASKHRFDEMLMGLPLRAVVLRPSIVYTTRGSYGGTSLLRALASFPGGQILPGEGEWLIQPVAAEDVGMLVALAAEGSMKGIFEVGAPRAISLRAYQQSWRRWLRLPGEHKILVPEWLVSVQVWLLEHFGSGPMGKTMWRMLRRGNVTTADAAERLGAEFGFVPRDLDQVLASHPSQTQDRWHARLYFLAPALRSAVIFLWLLSGWVGLTATDAGIEQLSKHTPLEDFEPVLLARAGGALDLVLAMWLASRWRPRMALVLMGLSVLAYTFVLGGFLQGSWHDPLGGVAKNLVVLPALAVLWVLMDRR